VLNNINNYVLLILINNMGRGAHAAHAAYNGSGTQGLAVTNKINENENEETHSVFLTENDTTKQIVHGCNISEMTCSGKIESVNSERYKIFTPDENADMLGDIYLNFEMDSKITGIEFDDKTSGTPFDLQNVTQEDLSKSFSMGGEDYNFMNVDYTNSSLPTVSSSSSGSEVSYINKILHVTYSGVNYEIVVGKGMSNIAVKNLSSNTWSNHNISNFSEIIDNIMINVDIPVTGYTSAPTVTIDESPSGSSASATAVVTQSGTVDDINIFSGGSGYTSAPTVTIDPPPGSTATATVLASVELYFGVIDTIVVDLGGSGYTSAPTVTIDPPPGTTATATAILTGDVVTSIVVDLGGSRYSYGNLPTVTIDPSPSGSSATANAILTGNVVTSIVVDLGGSGYTSAPTVTIDPPPGSTATATAILTGDVVTSIVVDLGGSGYYPDPLPNVTIDPPHSTATATAILTGNVVTSIDVLLEGSGYTSAPTVTIDPPDSSATATAILTGDVVTSFGISSGGSGYTSPPTITIAPSPSGSSATATTVLTHGVVTAINIDTKDLLIVGGTPVTGGSPYKVLTLSNSGTTLTVKDLNVPVANNYLYKNFNIIVKLFYENNNLIMSGFKYHDNEVLRANVDYFHTDDANYQTTFIIKGLYWDATYNLLNGSSINGLTFTPPRATASKRLDSYNYRDCVLSSSIKYDSLNYAYITGAKEKVLLALSPNQYNNNEIKRSYDNGLNWEDVNFYQTPTNYYPISNLYDKNETLVHTQLNNFQFLVNDLTLFTVANLKTFIVNTYGYIKNDIKVINKRTKMEYDDIITLDVIIQLDSVVGEPVATDVYATKYDLSSYVDIRIKDSPIIKDYEHIWVNIRNNNKNFKKIWTIGQNIKMISKKPYGTITRIKVINGGIGYTDVPDVVIDPPSGLTPTTATAVLTGPAVTSIVVDFGGTGYTTIPGVTIDPPPPGTTATATAVLAGPAVTSIVVDFGGSGYAVAPDVTFDPPPPGPPATATVLTMDGGGGVANGTTSIVVDFGGSGYAVAPDVTFDPPPGVVDWVNSFPPYASAVLTGDVVTSI